MIKYITTVLSCHVWPLYSTSQKFRTASYSLEWESVSKLLTGAVYIFAVQRQFLNWRSNWVFGWREAKVHPVVLIAETKPDPLSSTAKSDTESDRLSDLLFRLEVLHFRSWTTDSQPCFFYLLQAFLLIPGSYFQTPDRHFYIGYIYTINQNICPYQLIITVACLYLPLEVSRIQFLCFIKVSLCMWIIPNTRLTCKQTNHRRISCLQLCSLCSH